MSARRLAFVETSMIFYSRETRAKFYGRCLVFYRRLDHNLLTTIPSEAKQIFDKIAARSHGGM